MLYKNAGVALMHRLLCKHSCSKITPGNVSESCTEGSYTPHAFEMDPQVA